GQDTGAGDRDAPIARRRRPGGTVTGLARASGRVLWVAGWPARMALVGLIGVYRATLSGVLGGQCRFHPSCSVYAQGATRNRGAVVGSSLGVWRILRCSPLSRGGVDPPPQARTAARSIGAAAAYDQVI